jgi:Xaa-Pro aminopeptidase
MPVTAGLATLIIAASESSADLYYATAFLAPDPFVYVQLNGRSLILASDLEVDRARRQARVDEVWPLRRYEERARERGAAGAGMIEAAAEALRELGVGGVTVPATFPLAHADSLRARGWAVRPRADPFFEARTRKTPEEVGHIRETQRRTETALGEAMQAIREAEVRDGVLYRGGEPLTSEAIKSLLARRLLELDCLATHSIVACGVDGCDPHHSGAGPLRANESIILDVFPQSLATRYHADITRTVVKGRASDALKRMYEAALRAQERAFVLIRGRADGTTIHAEVERVFADAGFTTGEVEGRMQGFFHGTGHGLGLEIHEPPRIAKRGAILEPGHVVTVEPGLYYPAWGAVRIEDVVVVTEDGCENLTRFPKFLELD